MGKNVGSSRFTQAEESGCMLAILPFRKNTISYEHRPSPLPARCEKGKNRGKKNEATGPGQNFRGEGKVSRLD